MKKLKEIGVIIVCLGVIASLAGCDDTIESMPALSETESIEVDPTEETEETALIEYEETTTEKRISSVEVQIPMEYYEVVDSIVKYVNNFDPNVLDEYIGMTNTSGIAEVSFYDNALDRLGYAFVDIDGDFVAELAILECIDEYSEYRVLELYTFYDEEVHHVFSGWVRNSFMLLDDMSFLNTSSSGAAYTAIINYVYNSDRHALSFVDSLFTVSGSDHNLGSDEIYLCHTANESLLFTVEDGVEVMGKLNENLELFDRRPENLYEYRRIVKLRDYVSDNPVN